MAKKTTEKPGTAAGTAVITEPDISGNEHGNAPAEEREGSRKHTEPARLDPVTGLNSARTGLAVAVNLLSQNTGNMFFSAAISIVNFYTLLQQYGQIFCDSLLEETAIIIRRIIPEDYIIYRGGTDEFIVLMRTENRSEVKKLMSLIINEIEEIYGDSDALCIECAAGVHCFTAGEPSELSIRKTQIAAATARKFREKYSGLVFLDEADDDDINLP